jgi:2-haloacid dehalogenase
MTTQSRRDFVLSGSAFALTATVAGAGLVGFTRADTQPNAKDPAKGVKALFFDVFGTLVDWRSGVAREEESILKPLGHALDWFAFADAWRDQYQPGMEAVRSGRVPYTKLDVLHRQMLVKIAPQFGLEKLTDPQLDQLTLAWHRLDVWKDVPAGLARLGQRFLLAPVSNGNIAIMADLARRNHLRWDAVLGADLARNYKQAAVVYLAAADAFGLKPSECMMCAAHSNDLKAAADNGLQTAFIARPQERPGVSESGPKQPVDVLARNTLDLASQLGA